MKMSNISFNKDTFNQCQVLKQKNLQIPCDVFVKKLTRER